MKLSSGVLLYYFTSGLDMISCSSYGRFLSFLYAKSPKLLERFNPPFTLPLTILPPTFAILWDYIGFSGLWSKDNWIALPFLQSTLLESPALATYIFFFVISTTLAVHPAPSLILFYPKFDP